MDKNTARKILSDPEFDPTSIFEEAILEYMTKNSAALSKDKAAIKYLINDVSMVKKVAEEFDINNLELVQKFLITANKNNWGGTAAKHTFMRRLAEVQEKNRNAIIEIIIEFDICHAIGNISPEFYKSLNHKQKTLLLENIPSNNTLINIPFDLFMDNPSSIMIIMNKIVQIPESTFNVETTNKVSFMNFHRKIAKAALTMKDTAHEQEFINLCVAIWNKITCFGCGRTFRSMSGYSLHLKSLHDDLKIKSPCATILGLDHHYRKFAKIYKRRYNIDFKGALK